MVDYITLKIIYSILTLAIVTFASILTDRYPRASRAMRVAGFLVVPSLFILLGLVELQGYQIVLTLLTSGVAIGISLHNEGYYRVIYGLARYSQIIVDTILASLILLFSSTFLIELIVYWFFIDITVAFIAITMEHGSENLPVASTYIAMCIAPSDIALLTMWAILAGELGLYNSLLFPLNKVALQPLSLNPVISTIILFGFAVKLGQFPLHSWLPIVHGKAPSHISAILSGIIIKMGAYAFLTARQIFAFNPMALYIILAQGIISTIYGSFGAVLQSHIKWILAYSSVSYGGVITTLYAIMMILEGSAPLYASSATHINTIGLLNALILMVIVFHALTKSLAFVNSGMVYQLTNTYDVFKLGYLFYVSRESSLSAFTVLLSLTGIPPSVGFVVKILLISTSLLVAQVNLLGLVLAIAFILSTLLSIIYGAKYMGVYISTLPRVHPRTVIIPKVELYSETYLSVVSITVPMAFILYLTLFQQQPGNLVGIIATPIYIIALMFYVYSFLQIYSKKSAEEDVKYWLSGVDS
ncbi:MAG: proton-conducting transporter membrane subunit [Desulfurococcaceae archaeon]